MARLVGAAFCTPKGGWFDSGQGTYLGCGFDPCRGDVGGNQSMVISLPFSLSLPLSLKLIKRKEKKRREKRNMGGQKVQLSFRSFILASASADVW